MVAGLSVFGGLLFCFVRIDELSLYCTRVVGIQEGER